MLRAVSLAEQWRRIQAGLPDAWAEVHLVLTVADDGQAARAAALLAPLNPGRRGSTLRFSSRRRVSAAGPEAIRRSLRRLDAERIGGELQLASVSEPQAEVVAVEPSRAAFATSWALAVAELPPDWSDVSAELELDSTDHLERGALLLAPVNPFRVGARPAFRFRVARSFGYGASPQMAQRCLERLDQERITGRVQILMALSDTDPVGTQGPVWYVGGKTV
jgi:hypothetical protein